MAEKIEVSDELKALSQDMEKLTTLFNEVSQFVVSSDLKSGTKKALGLSMLYTFFKFEKGSEKIGPHLFFCSHFTDPLLKDNYLARKASKALFINDSDENSGFKLSHDDKNGPDHIYTREDIIERAIEDYESLVTYVISEYVKKEKREQYQETLQEKLSYVRKEMSLGL